MILRIIIRGVIYRNCAIVQQINFINKNMNKKLAALLGKRIAKIRKSKGLTQDKLALLAEIDRSYVGRIERGEVNITIEKLYEIAETLGCDAKELLP